MELEDWCPEGLAGLAVGWGVGGVRGQTPTSATFRKLGTREVWTPGAEVTIPATARGQEAVVFWNILP